MPELLELREKNPIVFDEAQSLADERHKPISVLQTKGGFDLYLGKINNPNAIIIVPTTSVP